MRPGCSHSKSVPSNPSSLDPTVFERYRGALRRYIAAADSLEGLNGKDFEEAYRGSKRREPFSSNCALSLRNISLRNISPARSQDRCSSDPSELAVSFSMFNRIEGWGLRALLRHIIVPRRSKAIPIKQIPSQNCPRERETTPAKVRQQR
jgi:hypothetical protein